MPTQTKCSPGFRLSTKLIKVGMLFAILTTCFGLFSSEANAQKLANTPQAVPAAPALPQPILIESAGVDGANFTVRAPMIVNYDASTSYGYSWVGGSANSPLVDFLSNSNVQNQIEMSSDQKKMFTDYQKKLAAEYNKIREGFPELKDKNLPAAARNKLNRTVFLKYKEVKEEISKEIEENLVPQQMLLVKQLKFKQFTQLFGWTRALKQAPFKDEIDLDKDQNAELDKIKKEAEVAIQKKVQEMREAAKQKMLKVLDSKQRKLLKEWEGEKKAPANARL